MALGEFDDLFGDECEMAHVSQAHVRLGLSFIAGSLAFDDSVGDLAGLKEVDREGSIVASGHLAIENLLHYIVYDIVKEVVPWEAEEEVLSNISISGSQEVKRLDLPES